MTNLTRASTYLIAKPMQPSILRATPNYSKHAGAFLAIALLLSAGCAQIRDSVGVETANDPHQEEWIQLFNGKNLDEWDIKFAGHPLNENLNGTFSVEDGLLKVRYDDWSGFDGEFGHIFYREPFSHYKVAV